MWNFSSFTEYVQKKRKIPTSKVLTTEIVKKGDREYLKFERARGVKENEEVLYLTVDTSFIPFALFPGINTYDFEKRSLYEVMRKEYGINPSIVEVSIQPYIVDERIANILGVITGTPLLLVKGQVSNEENLEVEFTQVIYSPNVDFKLATRINS